MHKGSEEWRDPQSPAIPIVIALFVFVCQIGCRAIGNGSDQEIVHIVLSGKVAETLKDNGVLLMDSYFYSRKTPTFRQRLQPMTDGLAANMPKEMDNLVVLDLLDQSEKRVSVLLLNGKNLSREKTIIIDLDEAKPWIEVSVMKSAIVVHYKVDVKRDEIQWASLPYLDVLTRRLTEAPAPIVSVLSGSIRSKVLSKQPMEDSCWGQEWYKEITITDVMRNEDTIVVLVTQDTGAVFGKFEIERALDLGASTKEGP